MTANPITRLPRELLEKIYETVFECELICPNSHCEAGVFRGVGDRCLFIQESSNDGRDPKSMSLPTNFLLCFLWIVKFPLKQHLKFFYKKTVFTGQIRVFKSWLGL
jgi:hypothetical protein